MTTIYAYTTHQRWGQRKSRFHRGVYLNLDTFQWLQVVYGEGEWKTLYAGVGDKTLEFKVLHDYALLITTYIEEHNLYRKEK